jgi:hypothetical protein
MLLTRLKGGREYPRPKYRPVYARDLSKPTDLIRSVCEAPFRLSSLGRPLLSTAATSATSVTTHRVEPLLRAACPPAKTQRAWWRTSASIVSRATTRTTPQYPHSNECESKECELLSTRSTSPRVFRLERRCAGRSRPVVLDVYRPAVAVRGDAGVLAQTPGPGDLRWKIDKPTPVARIFVAQA